MKPEQKELYDKFVQYAIDNWSEHQIDMAIEESAEFILSLCHLRRGKNNIDDVISEIADIENMIGQIKAIYNITDEEVDNERISKIKRAIKKYDIDV
jgi:hypothetical protein